jgi:two-component system, NarL family, sensor kinase
LDDRAVSFNRPATRRTVDATSVDHFEIDATLGRELGYAFCRSLALVARSTSVNLISPAGSPLGAYPSDMVISGELASWLRRLEAVQPILWQGAEVSSALPAGVIPQRFPAAVALVPLAYEDGPWSAVLLCWREAPAPALTTEWLASLALFAKAYCERARLHRVLQQREERWQALYETTLALTQELGSTELLQRILERSIRLQDAAGGAILLIDPERDELAITVAASSTNRAADSIGRRIRRGEGIAWQAIEARRPLVVSHYDNWSGRTDVVADMRIASALGVPLLGQNGPFGAIVVAKRDEAGVFTEDDVHLVELFAQAAAAALEAADARRRSEELALRQEQARLAGDLHDGIAQDLASLLLRADLCQQTIGPAQAETSAQLEAISRGLQKAIRDARATIWALRNPDWGDCLLEESLRAQIVQFEAQTGIPVQYHVEGEACERLSNIRELTLLRAAQEAMHNIHKHAQATQAIVYLTWETGQGEVGVSISDDGCGIRPEARQPSNGGSNLGVGLTIMQERVEALGGRVSVASGIERGTTVRVVLPIENGAGKPGHA